MNRDRSPWRFLPVHLLDVARGPLLLFIAVSAGLALVLWRLLPQGGPLADGSELLGGLVSGTLMIGVLFATGGVAGVDIKQGYYRAYFSKPMAPWWFYLQRWLLGGLAVLTIPIWLGLGLQVFLGHGTGLSWQIFAAMGLCYLLIGGLVLLCSTVTARDWLVAFLVYFLQAQLHNAHEMLTRLQQDVPAAVTMLLRILPPFHLIRPGADLPTGLELMHVAGYGLAMVIAALLILAWRPLGSGGRA